MKKLKVIVISLLIVVSMVVHAQEGVLMTKNDTVEIAYTNINKQRLVGAVDVVQGNELLHSSEYSPNMILPGLASGLYVDKSAAGPGFNWSGLKVRGLSRGNDNDGPMVVVDGIPNRSLSDLTVQSIESVTVLKDVTAKMLYGSQAANGVILVKTLRGKKEPLSISFSVEGGIKLPTALPDYLDAAAYAEKYNQARANDGLEPFYTPSAIDAYKNGSSPLYYPNEDYVGTFLKDFTDYERINSIITGGDEKTRFFLNLEYVHESGMETVKNARMFDQINMVSNLDYQVNDIVTASLDIATRIGLHQNSNVGDNELFTKIALQRPNDYPFFVTKDQSANTDSLGYNTKGTGNLYGDITRGGYNNGQDFRSQTTFGLGFDLNQYVKGLSADVSLGFDSYNSIYKGKSLGYATYRILDGDTLLRVGDDEIKNDEQRFADDYYRNLAGYANLAYSRNFGLHSVNSNLNYSARRLAYKTVLDAGSVKQDLKGINAGLQVNYAYDNKYILQLNSSYMGSDRFDEGNRFKLYGAAGAAWVISKEDFMSDVESVNFLKLKASYGKMGYDNSIDYYKYRNEYGGGGAYYFGYQNASADYGFRISQYGNEGITFEESTELNVGLEAVLFKNKLSIEANYFNELRSGMPVIARSSLPSYVWGAASTINYNEVRNQGLELNVSFSNQVNDFKYTIGANMIYSKSVYEAIDEIVVYELQSRLNKATDSYFGLVAEGLYRDQADIDAHGVTSSFGDVLPGDIKYANITNDLGDNIINEYDAKAIGNWYPRINYGVNVDLEYKGLGLYLLGQGIAQVDRMLSNQYFWNFGERKYTDQILEEGYPRLTTNASGGHSFLSSTYWLEDGSFFKLRTAELSYKIPTKLVQGLKAQNMKVFVRGTDLFTVSKIKKLDPEDLNAGISKYPMFTTVTFGAKITF